MQDTLEFPDLLRLIDERSTAFRAAIAAAPDLDAPVPTCPDWTLFDLARHIGDGRRAWAATLAAGPGATAKSAPPAHPAAPRDREALLAWLADSTQAMLDELRAAGPDRGSWVGWADSQSPRNCGAVARRQVQELAVHTYDAQVTVSGPRPLPDDVALDGVEEFLFTCVATPVAWPHEPATIDHHATEGRSWRLHLSADGARAERLADATDMGDASIRGKAGDILLFQYGRISPDRFEFDGDLRHIDRLVDWDPTE